MNSDEREIKHRNQEDKSNSICKMTGPVKLSPRLQAVAGFVKQGSRIADIGTDHGYVPVYLAQTGRIRSALAMDVRTGPLERARAHVEEYVRRRGAEAAAPDAPGEKRGSAAPGEPGEKREAAAPDAPGKKKETAAPPVCPIETRLSDGLKELRPGETDTVIMAGMGGELIIRILEEGRHVWESTDRFILSPQSGLDKVRRYLAGHGFAIEDEAMVKDEGKYYTVMSVRRGEMEYDSQAQYLYGRILISRKDNTLKEYLERETHRIEGIIKSLEAGDGTARTRARVSALGERREELSRIKEAQDEMQ